MTVEHESPREPHHAPRQDDETPQEQPVLDPAEARAFDYLYTDYALHVRRVIRRFLWGAVVDDVVQETFTQAFRSGLHLERETIGEGRTARRIAGMARNRSIDVLRQRMRGLEEIADDGRLVSVASTSPDADPERRLLSTRRQEAIVEALSALCERQRRVLLMREVDGHSYEQIAEIEGISVDSVKAALARGRRVFRELYAALAEQRGLNVLLGGRMLAALRARLRSLRDRVAAGTGEALNGLAAASPGFTHVLATAVVVGAVAVVGVGTAAASEAGGEPSAYEEPQRPGRVTARSSLEVPHAAKVHAGADVTVHEAGGHSLGEHSVTVDDPQVDPRPVTHPSASVDSEDITPGENDAAQGSASVSSGTDIDQERRQARSAQNGTTRAATSTSVLKSATGTTVENDVETGCIEGDSPELAVQVCPKESPGNADDGA